MPHPFESFKAIDNYDGATEANFRLHEETKSTEF